TVCDLETGPKHKVSAARFHRIRRVDGRQYWSLAQPALLPATLTASPPSRAAPARACSEQRDGPWQMNTTCGDAVGWTALPVWETGERSGERESTSPSCAHSCSCAGSWTRIAISLARSKRLRRNMTRNSRWSSKRSSNSLLRPSQNRPGAESGFTPPKSLSTLVSPRDVAKLYVLPSSFLKSSFILLNF